MNLTQSRSSGLRSGEQGMTRIEVDSPSRVSQDDQGRPLPAIPGPAPDEALPLGSCRDVLGRDVVGSGAPGSRSGERSESRPNVPKSPSDDDLGRRGGARAGPGRRSRPEPVRRGTPLGVAGHGPPGRARPSSSRTSRSGRGGSRLDGDGPIARRPPQRQVMGPEEIDRTTADRTALKPAVDRVTSNNLDSRLHPGRSGLPSSDPVAAGESQIHRSAPDRKAGPSTGSGEEFSPPRSAACEGTGFAWEETDPEQEPGSTSGSTRGGKASARPTQRDHRGMSRASWEDVGGDIV